MKIEAKYASIRISQCLSFPVPEAVVVEMSVIQPCPETSRFTLIPNNMI